MHEIMNPCQPVIYGRHALGSDIWRGEMPLGLSLAEIAARVPGLPADFDRYGAICVDGSVVPRFVLWDNRRVDAWRVTRPRARADGMARVTLHMGLQGKGLKSVISVIASIALVAVASFITGGGFALAGGLFAANSLSALALAAGVSILGRLAISALGSPAGKARTEGDSRTATTLGNAGASGNQLLRGGDAIPRCLGAIKIYPPFAATPLVSIEGDDEIIEAAYVLAGPHAISDVRVEGAVAAEIEGLQISVSDGQGQIPGLVSRHGLQRAVNVELKAHQRQKDNPAVLRNQDSPEITLPTWKTEVSESNPDEIWLHFVWPQGMGFVDSSRDCVMPLRLRMRELGTSSWINLPELFFRHRQASAIRMAVKLIWRATAPVADGGAQTFGGFEAFHTVPGQTDTPTGLGAWQAHASFVNTAGIYNDCRRVERASDGFTLSLDPAVFQRNKVWEVSVKRGSLYNVSGFAPSTYSVGALVRSLFDYYEASGSKWAPWNLNYNSPHVESCVLARVASVRNTPPLPLGGDAQIQIRGKNIQVGQLSCRGAGLVPVLSGGEWAGREQSDNPADHYRYVLSGDLSRDPVRIADLDDQGLAFWRGHCTTQNYRINAAVDGRGWRDTLDLIAAAGWARRREGARFGVVIDRDRSGDIHIPLITPRNANNFIMRKSFQALPAAIRVSYRNEAEDFDEDEELVRRPGVVLEAVEDIEAAESGGITGRERLIAHFSHKLAEAAARDMTVECDVHVESLVYEQGDVVGLCHVMLSRHAGYGRVRDIESNGAGEALAMTLDAAKAYGNPVKIENVADFTAIAELADQGVALGCAIRTGSATTLSALISHVEGETRRIVFSAPFDATGVRAGDMIALGPVSQAVQRMIIRSITRARRFTARLDLVPEAPELFS